MQSFYLKKINNIQIVSASKTYIKNLEKSLKGLKYWDANNFDKVIKNFDTILIHPKNKNYNHTIASKKLWISGYEAFENNDYDIPYITSLLIHEAHHVAQYFSGHKNYGEKAETSAYKKQRKFLKKIKYDYAVEWLDKQYENKWWEQMDADNKNKKKADDLIEDYEKGRLPIKRLKSIII